MTTGTYTNPLSTGADSSIEDAFLGPEVATDHDRPPLGSYVFGPNYDGTCFIIKDNLLYYCKAKQPEYWPPLNFIEVSPPQFPGQTGVFYNNQPYYLTKNEIYLIQGTGSSSFFPLPTQARTGAQSIQGAVAIDALGIFHTGPDGIYLYANGTDKKISEDSLETIFRGNTVEGLPGVDSLSTSWLKVFQNQLYFGYKGASDTYPANVLVMNLETNQIQYYIYNDGSNVEIRTIAVDNTNNRLLVGDNTGFVRVIEDQSTTTDSSTAISFDLKSKDFTLQTRRTHPRWAKYDVDVPSGSSATGEIFLDDVSHKSHTITGSRITKRRLIDTENGNRTAIRISGSGPATIYVAELE